MEYPVGPPCNHCAPQHFYSKPRLEHPVFAVPPLHTAVTATRTETVQLTKGSRITCFSLKVTLHGPIAELVGRVTPPRLIGITSQAVPASKGTQSLTETLHGDMATWLRVYWFATLLGIASSSRSCPQNHRLCRTWHREPKA